MHLPRIVATAALAAGLLASPAAGYSSGSPADRVNRPPEEFSCLGCHGTAAISDGAMTIQGVGPRFSSRPEFKRLYRRNATNALVVGVVDPGVHRWGFQVAAMDSTTAQTQVGSLHVTDTKNTQKITDGAGREFVEQTFIGTCVNDEECLDGIGGCPDAWDWGFSWRSPPIDVPVRFFFCSVGADADCLAGPADRIRCDSVVAFPDPEIRLEPSFTGPGEAVIFVTGGLSPRNLWAHSLPDFDRPDDGVMPWMEANVPDVLLAPECGAPICYYLVE